jgi:hypothetical protein
MKHFVFAALIAGAIGAVSFVSPASAQATRTWVSATGSDANPCSRTAPCQTFAGAYSKTAIAGEINCIDSGGFGTLTIAKSIAIVCNGVVAGVLASGTVGFTVNVASTDRVILDGVDIEGVGTGTNGVNIVGSGSTIIRNCSIRHFTGNGVNLVGTAGARVVVQNCLIANNTGGLNVQGAGGASNVGSLVDTLLDENTSFAAQATGAGNTIGLVRSILNNSPAGLKLVSSATATSFGPSNIITGTVSPFSTTAFQ